MLFRHTAVSGRPRLRRITALTVAAAIALPFVQPLAVLGQGANSTHRGSGGVSDALLVKLRPGVADADAGQILARAGATELAAVSESRIHVVSVPASSHWQARQTLQSDPRVESVEEDAIASAAVEPRDPYWDHQWNVRRIRGTEAWDVTRGDSSVIIAIVDTGVDGSHPDLRGRMVKGWDFQNNDANPYDDDGHGTAVATTAAAAGNDRVGIAGMCWACRIMPVKVLNSQGHGSHSNIAAGIMWAADHGADVINLSIAGLSATELLGDSIAYALRRGLVVVAAAGNAGTTRKMYPAAYPGVISVAATNELDRLYSWSTRGSWVTLAAPGCSFSGRPHARWSWLCGTSLAAPIVSGTVGLMKSVAPRLSPGKVASLLTGSTTRLRISTANGRLDAARVLHAASGTASRPDPTPTPRATATPKATAKPTPTPTHAAHGTYVWRGTLDSDDHWDRSEFWLRGLTHVKVKWWGTDELAAWVVGPDGNVLKHQEGDSIFFEMDASGGTYTITVQETNSDDVSYEVDIEYGI
jgi:subtilisin family serine protease